MITRENRREQPMPPLISAVYMDCYFFWGSQSKVWNQVEVRESMTLQKADCCTESLTHHIVTSYYFVILSVFTSPYVWDIFAYRCTAYNLWEVAEPPCHLTGLDSWRRSRLSIEFLRCLVNFFMIHLFHKRTEKIWKDMWKKHAKNWKICEKPKREKKTET